MGSSTIYDNKTTILLAVVSMIIILILAEVYLGFSAHWNKDS